MMTKKLSNRRSTDYGPLKDALTEHISTFPFDREFFVTDLVDVAKSSGYSEAHLPYAVASLTRTGIIERVGHHKRDYQNIIHYRRAKTPKPLVPKQRVAPEDSTDERMKRMNEACMRLWRAFGMPVIRAAA